MINIKDRIVEFKRIKPGEALPHKSNWKEHTDSQRAILRALLSEIGIVDVALCYYSKRNKGKLTFFDGHMRGEEIEGDLPVIITDLNDEEADRMLFALDQVAGEAKVKGVEFAQLLKRFTSATDNSALKDFAKRLASKTNSVTNQNDDDSTDSQIGVFEYRVIVECKDEKQQAKLLQRLEKEGLQCRALIS